MVYLPNLGTQLINIITELWILRTGLLELEIHHNRDWEMFLMHSGLFVLIFFFFFGSGKSGIHECIYKISEDKTITGDV